MKKILLVSALTAAVIPFFNANAATPEVSASAAVSNFYMSRGQDLSDGDAQVSGDLSVSLNGFYGGTWASSGDDSLGTEYDLYAGYNRDITEDFTADISYWSYLYPSSDIDFGESAEIITAFGYGPVTTTVYFDVSSDNTSFFPDPDDDGVITYASIGASYGKFYGLIGKHHDDAWAEGLVHADITYSYNDYLSFTVTAPLHKDESGDKSELTQDPKINVAFNLPVDFFDQS